MLNYQRDPEGNYPVVNGGRFGAFGVPIYPLFNEEPRSYLEFPTQVFFFVRSKDGKRCFFEGCLPSGLEGDF